MSKCKYQLECPAFETCQANEHCARAEEASTDDQALPPGVSRVEWSVPANQTIMNQLLDEELANRGNPSNMKNAARAGWYAAMRYVNSRRNPTEEKTS
jgi:hypothetical protein